MAPATCRVRTGGVFSPKPSLGGRSARVISVAVVQLSGTVVSRKAAEAANVFMVILTIIL